MPVEPVNNKAGDIRDEETVVLIGSIITTGMYFGGALVLLCICFNHLKIAISVSELFSIFCDLDLLNYVCR